MTRLRRGARSVLGLPLALVLMGTGWSPEPPEPTFQAFGPRTFHRASGRPVPVVARFAVADPLAPYTLRVIVRDSHDRHDRHDWHDRHDRHDRHDGTTSAVIRLNGTTVFGPSHFGHAHRVVSRRVVLAADNELSVELRGKPGGRITVEVVGTDAVAPVLALAAPGDASTLRVEYSDATAGIDLASLRVTLDGADITATCAAGPSTATCAPAAPAPGAHTATAVIRDRAGNLATATLAFEVGGDGGPVLSNVVAPSTLPLGGAGLVGFDYATAGAPISHLVRTRRDALGQETTEEIPARLIGIRDASGHATFALPASTLAFGENAFTLRLRDGSDRLSPAASFAVSLVAASSGGGAPVIERFTVDPAAWTRPPAASYGPNGRGLTSKLRPPFVLGFGDPDGDIDRLRVRVVDPLGQATTSELGATSLRITGPAGTVQHAFLTLRAASPPGLYRVEATLIDRAGHLSAPAEATVELRETGGAAPLAITGFAPAGGAAGTEVVLDGTGFSTDEPADNVVSLAQILADVVEVTPTSIRVIVPAGAGTGKLVVRNRLGVAVSDGVFAVPVSVSVTPADAEVVVTDSQQLAAAVVSSFFTDVRWSVNGIPGGDATVGTITPAGLYTAPSDIPPGGTVTVAAALRVDPAVRGEVTVRVAPPPLTPGRATVLASVGGTVRSPQGGAQVSIPPGALPATTVITVAELRGAAAPAPEPGRRVLGAVALGPSPLAFLQPVTVTVPLARFVVPGTRLPLAFVAPDGGFDRTEAIVATVLESGEQAAAAIGHFSTIALDEPEPAIAGGAALPVPRIDTLVPASGEEGARVPVLLTGAGLTADLAVRVLRADGSPTGDIVPGPLYASGGNVGLLLAIQTIADLAAGAARDYLVRLERLAGLQTAEAVFTVTGLDELIVTDGTHELGEPAGDDLVVRRFSEVRVTLPGQLRTVPRFLRLEVTGPVLLDGPVRVDGANGASGSGQEPGLRRERAGSGGRGRDDNGCFELPFGVTPGADGFDCAETENWGEDADRCVGLNSNNPRSTADCLRVSQHPRGMGGRPGFNEDNLSLGDFLAGIASAIGCAVSLGVGCIVATGANVFDVIDAFTIDETITLGGNGFGAHDGSGGGGAGGGGKVDGVTGGGGGAGGEPGRNLRLITADRLELRSLVTAQGGNGGGGGIVQDCGGDSADLSADPRRIEETIRCSGEAGAFFVRLKDNVEGVVLSETQEGIAAFVQGQLDAGASLGDILSNVVDTFGEEAADEVLRSLEDPSPAGIAAALFRSLFGGIKLTNLVNTGGGGGGGSGGGLNLAAGLGVLRDAGGRTSVRPGDGGFGGVTIVDDLNSNLFHFVYRSTRPAEAFGGSRVVSDGTDDAGVAVFDHSTIQTGVTDRTLLRDVRVHALGIADRSTDPVTLHPIKITVTCETTGAFTNAIVARAGGDRMATATFFLCPGFNQLAAEISVEPSSEPVTSMHALLQKRILVVAVDSDGDGLGDRDEAALGTDPLRQDSDADGLPDGDEVLRGTDPVRADTDGDGLGDGDEVARGTNPLGSDTDGDGVGDGVEVLLGTDPRSAASRATALPAGTLLAGSDSALAIVDASTGFAGLLSQLPVAGGFGLAFDAAGRLHVALGGRLAWHDPLAGTTTDVGAFGGGIEVVRLAFDPIDALLYGVEPSGQLVRIDPVTGAAARVGVPGPDPVHALAFDRTGALFAAVAGGGGSDRLVQLDPATGAIVTELGPIGFAPVLGLAFDRAGALLGVHLVSSAASELLVIDPATGLGAASVPIARPLSGLTIAPCPAPCFAPPASHAAGGGLPMSIAVVDMNGDGLLDVVTANASTVDVSVLLGNGDGTFQAARRFPAGGSFSQLSGLAVGDLDGDGFPDVVTGDRPTQRVLVFLNDGAGGLGPATPFPVGGLGNTLNAMAIGDLTGDGIPDVAAGQFFTEGSVSVLAGDGAGGFAPPVATPAFRFGIRALAIGDVDGDGLPDVATGHADGTVVLLYGDGAGGFPRSLVTRPVDAASALAIADATGDGRLDIVATGFEGSRLAVLPSNGLAGLGPAISLSVGPGAHNPVGVAVGDLTGDGVADLVTANFRSASISVLVGDGRLGFRSGLQSPYPVAPGGASGVALGDLNGDGLIDVVVADPTGTVIVLTNQSPF